MLDRLRLLLFPVFFFWFKLMFYVWFGMQCNLYNMWSWTIEPQGSMCKHKPLGGNNSGLKVLIYGPAKTGTTTMSRALHDVGFKSYHSEDFFFHVWGPLTDVFYHRPENGGQIWAISRLATPVAPANRGHSTWNRDDVGSDLRVLKEIEREELAAAISKCRVEALAFDAMVEQFWPLYNLSPNAKVIVMNWRTQEEIQKSKAYYDWGQNICLYMLNLLGVGMHILPWNAFLLPILDPLFGNPIEEFMRNGEPFHRGIFNSMGHGHLLVCIWRLQLAEHRRWQHGKSGFTIDRPHATRMKQFWEAVNVVPAENRFDWNMKKHTFGDLCKFLNISGKPVCELSGTLPNTSINALTHEREQTLVNKVLVLMYYIFLHVIDWGIFYGIIGWFSIQLSRLLVKPRNGFKES